MRSIESPTSRQLDEDVQVRAPAERMSQAPSKRLPYCAALEPVHGRLRISAAGVSGHDPCGLSVPLRYHVDGHGFQKHGLETTVDVTLVGRY
jgi:hypothetical protein